MNELPALISVADVRREFLKVSPNTIKAWDVAGHIPQSMMIGGRRLWHREHWRIWLERGCPRRDQLERYLKAERHRSA